MGNEEAHTLLLERIRSLEARVDSRLDGVEKKIDKLWARVATVSAVIGAIAYKIGMSTSWL
jgi:hypothetical protein